MFVPKEEPYSGSVLISFLRFRISDDVSVMLILAIVKIW